MKKVFILLAGVLILSIGISFQAAASEKEAVTAAATWLNLVDHGKYEESWKTASTLFKRNVSLDEWMQAVKAARESLGELVSRQYSKEEMHTSLPGVPDGKYVVIFFNSSFEKKKEAIETITPMLDSDGTWRVSGYYVR